MENRILDIHCPRCGAAAEFDIVRQRYVCGYCGGEVEINAALKEKQGFRKMRGNVLKESVRKYKLIHASCNGCGAEVVFEENEALSTCAFCGRNLVRSDYLDARNMPESVIPFGLTPEEARDRLGEWCHANSGKAEAKKLAGLVPELKGFYLPYELVQGPVHMKVSRMDGARSYRCEGFMRDEFVNRSRQLDNLLLDGMEPFDLDGLTEFDFAYVAGQRVKVSDIEDKVLEARVREEAEKAYRPAVRKTLETKAVEVDADVSSAVRLPVLLPVYYICRGDSMAAVNGQTGKVSVRAEKESHYHFLPWWLKAIVATLLFTGIIFGVFCLFGMDRGTSLLLTGVLTLYFIVVTLCLYSDTTRNSFSVVSGREIFTSGEKTFHRDRGELVLDEKLLARKIEDPVYFSNINGKEEPVILRFTSPVRIARMLLLATVALFLPVIIALFLNGFNFSQLNLGGSAVWFCIAVPVVPIYLLKFGIVELHDNPWIYRIREGGGKKRYRPKGDKISKDTVMDILRIVFIPPTSLAVWFGIICFFTMCYLTAFGW